MGVLSESNTNGEVMASNKPKERQFQVVAVPSTFTRGRWECRDFEDQQEVEKEILEFEKPDLTLNELVLTTTTIGISPSIDTVSMPATVSESKESSTILVTSVVSSHPQKIVSNSNESKTSDTVKTISTNVVHYELPATSQNSLQTGAQPVTTQYVQHTEIITTAKPEMLNNVQPNVSTFPVVENKVGVGVVTQISTQTQSITAIDPMDSETAATSTGVTITGANVVAIDNKIEQAMDLVKTHLTFAVREEVEILKNTIMELESKVALLENQNQILRQFAPPEVVANLAHLVQSNQQLRQQYAQTGGGVISPPVSLATQPQFPTTGPSGVLPNQPPPPIHHPIAIQPNASALPPRAPVQTPTTPHPTTPIFHLSGSSNGTQY